ncbi:Transposase DDE domain protein [compost metagenome]
MRASGSKHDQWLAVMRSLPINLDLETTARVSGALVCRRGIMDASSLLRLALAYGPGGLSLRGAATWAELAGLASISDVAILKRLRGAADWLQHIAGSLLASRIGNERPDISSRRIRIIDATTICPPRSNSILWRLHTSYDPLCPGFDDLQLTDQSEGEHLERFAIEAGDLIIADRGYARGSNFRHVVESGGDFIIRSGWKTQKLWMPESRSRFDVFKALGDIQEDEIADIHVVADRRDTGQPVDVRFIAMRKPQSAAYHSREQVRQRTRDTGKTPAPQSLIAADFMLVITSLSRDEYPPERVLALYRMRWQVELTFKRLKSLLHLGRLPAKDKALARSWIYAHLIVALLIDDVTQDLLDSPPYTQINSK